MRSYTKYLIISFIVVVFFVAIPLGLILNILLYAFFVGFFGFYGILYLLGTWNNKLQWVD